MQLDRDSATGTEPQTASVDTGSASTVTLWHTAHTATGSASEAPCPGPRQKTEQSEALYLALLVPAVTVPPSCIDSARTQPEWQG